MEIDTREDEATHQNGEHPHGAHDSLRGACLSTSLLRTPPSPVILEQTREILHTLSPRGVEERWKDQQARRTQIALTQTELNTVKYIHARLQGVEFRVDVLRDTAAKAEALKYLLRARRALVDAQKELQQTIDRLIAENAVCTAGQ